MIIVHPNNENQVYLAWLKSEFHYVKKHLTDGEISIIEHPDLENPEENRKRKNILLGKYNRSIIIHKLPNQIDWFKMEIEESDVEKLFVLPTLDWFLDTGQTFKLKNIPIHLSPTRGHRLLYYPQLKRSHYQKIDEISIYLKFSKETLMDLILIASSFKGPFTIIDGTHRAAVLCRDGKLKGTKGFLGVAEDLSQCFWSIERKDIGEYITKLNRLVTLGMIW